MPTQRHPMNLEQEVKLAAPDDFELPDLDTVAPGIVPGPPVTLDLDAVYFDTDDLVLARTGVTLRHRTGEPGPPWTLKLPQENGAPALVRRELHFDGPPDSVPAGAADVVRVYVRSRPLLSVVRLRTSRTAIVWQDAAGRPVVEVVDDAVKAYKGRRLIQRFREIEVELRTDDRRGARVLRDVVDRLVAAGCRADPPIPKAIRSLGHQAPAPPVVVPDVDRDTTMSQLVHHAFARSVSQIMRHDSGVRLGDNPEDVHQFRVGIRRLRSDLRTFASLFEPDWVAGLRAELAWVGGEIGSVRDTDVLIDRLRSQAMTLPESDAAAIALLLERLGDQRDRQWTAALDTLRSPRYDALIDALVDTACRPPFHDNNATGAARKHVVPLVRRQWRRLVSGVNALGDDPPDDALHHVRILAKRCRYAAEATTPSVGKQAARFAAAVADLQTVLGDHQDTVVADAWLRAAAAAAPDIGVAAGELIAIQRAERARLRESWPEAWKAASAKELRRWLR